MQKQQKNNSKQENKQQNTIPPSKNQINCLHGNLFRPEGSARHRPETQWNALYAIDFAKSHSQSKTLQNWCCESLSSMNNEEPTLVLLKNWSLSTSLQINKIFSIIKNLQSQSLYKCGNILISENIGTVGHNVSDLIYSELLNSVNTLCGNDLFFHGHTTAKYSGVFFGNSHNV